VHDLRWDIPTPARFEEVIRSPLPLGLRAGPPRLTFHRDLYFDTTDRDLARREVTVRLRHDLGQGRRLTLAVPGMKPCEAAVSELDSPGVLAGPSEPARRLRALVDPTRLGLRLELEVERRLHRVAVPLIHLPQFALALDVITARRHSESRTFQELVAWRARGGVIPLGWLGRGLERRHPWLTPAGARLDRADASLQTALQQHTRPAGIVVVIAVAHGSLGLCRDGAALMLPQHDGAGEEACRAAMRRCFGSAEGTVRRLAAVPAVDTRPPMEVWIARRLRPTLTAAPPAGLEWIEPAELAARLGSLELHDPVTLAALATAQRSDLLPEWSAVAANMTPFGPPPTPGASGADSGVRLTLSELRAPVRSRHARETVVHAPERLLNVQLSTVEFNARVLALAEDPRTPLAARLRFLAIFSTNIDQLFMVEVAALQQQIAAGMSALSPDGLTPAAQLEAIASRLRPLVARQYRVFAELLEGPLAEAGIALRDWPNLGPDERAVLERRSADEIVPLLTPKALTRAPGHPFPQIADRRLTLAVMMRDHGQEALHFAAVELPPTAPRLLPLPDGKVVPLEAVIRAQLAVLFPGRVIIAAPAFRLTRAGDIHLDELGTANFLQAIGEEVRRRSWGPVVRLEVERAMPLSLRSLLQRELRFEESPQHSALGPADIYEADGPVDLGSLGELARPLGPEHDYPPFTPGDPFAAEPSVCGALDRGDVLVHHPYDSFAASFERFIIEAADDPDCVAIKITLYRPGGPSRLGDALHRAATHGKDVSVFVELKARFDEEMNIEWARSLEASGIHVITGLATLKTHAKIALVVRRAGGHTRRYAHIGSGNYNPVTARLYTDFGLFTTDPGITEDLHALFNELTGSPRPPQAVFRRLLVAPTNMLDRFLALIARETEHARAGRGGRIRAKLNGLADATVIDALYRASQAGVNVDLVVRGLCMLRPAIPGLSERIRVVSVLGRFLEHGRIYSFANAGEPEYYIGSADWRPRNLRRRVEVVTPVDDPQARARLDRILDVQLGDPSAWTLQPDGSYARGPEWDPTAGAQEKLLEDRS
jgi:polyphosphate kinase